jgi:hypothetical protein
VAGVESDTWQPVESTLQATTELLADRVFRAGRGRRQRFLVYFEFFTRWDPDAPWGLLAKSGLLSERERLPTVGVVVVLQRRGFRSLGGEFTLRTSDGPTQQLWLKELLLWETDPERWWETVPGLMALYPLCRHGRSPQEAIRQAAGAIEGCVAATGERSDFLTLLGIFGKLAYPRLDVGGIIGREKMKESKFYQEILGEGEVKGELKARRADLLRVLRMRFGPDVAAELAGVVAGLDDPQRVAQLFELATTDVSLEEFRSALAGG